MANNKPIDKNYLVKQLKNYETEIIDKKYVKQQEGMTLSHNDYTNEEKALVATIEDKVDKSSIATALDDTATDEQVASALLAKTELDKKIDKTTIATTLSSESTNDEVVGAKLAYDELQKTELATKEQFATASGEAISVNDSVDGKIRDLKLYGKSEQKQYSGYQLLHDYASGKSKSVTSNGITYTVNDDGSITVNGTSTSTSNFELFSSNIEFENGTYTVSLKNGISGKLYIFCFGGNSGITGRQVYEGAPVTETISSGILGHMLIQVPSSITISNVTVYPMLEKGSVAHDFEPYVGCVPSPNPNYPQDIKSVVNPVVKSCGKNLLPKIPAGKKTINGIDITINDDGSIVLNGTPTKDVYLVTKVSLTIPSGVYKYSGGTSNTKDIYIMSSRGNYLHSSSNMTFKADEEWTISEIVIYVKNGITCSNEIIYPQLEKGSVITQYTPYTETTATIPYTLNAIPVESGGNVTIDGQEYIADYVDFEKKKLVRRVKKKDLGEFDWNYVYNVNPKLKYFDTTILDSFKPTASHPIGEGFCDSYSVEKNNIPQSDLANNKVAIGWLNTSSTRCCLEIRDDNYTNTLDFKNAVKGRYIYYQLATQETIDLTDEEVQAFRELATYYPTTNVFVTSDQLNGYAECKYPTTDVSGIVSEHDAEIEGLKKADAENFDALEQDIKDSVKNQFTTAGSDYITVNDSVDGNIVELGIKGNSFQNSYSGKNLLIYPYAQTTRTHNGVTFTDVGDGSIIANRVDSSITDNAYFQPTFRLGDSASNLFLEDGDYTMYCFGGDSNCYLEIFATKADESGTVILGNTSSGEMLNFTVNNSEYANNGQLGVTFHVKSEAAVNNRTFKFMICKGTLDSTETYEAYCGGIPAPNPSYPQPINSVGDDGSLVVTSCGKNLAKNANLSTSLTSREVTFVTKSDGTIVVNGTPTQATDNWVWRTGNSNFLLRKGKYLWTGCPSNDGSNKYRLLIRNVEKPWKENNDYGNGVTFELTEDKAFCFYIGISYGYVANNLTFKPMLRRCDDNWIPYGDDLYEPYKETTTTIPLSEPLRSIGDIKDEITYQNGKWGVLRRIKKLVADTPKLINPDGALTGTTYDILVNFEFDAQDSYNAVNKISDMSKHIFRNFQSINIWDKDECGVYISWAGSTSARLSSSICGGTLDEVKAYFKNNPLIGQYVLATPVFEPFTDQTLPYLSTYDGVTNIFNDDALPAEMTVKYPTTDASGVGSQNEAKIAKLEEDTEDKFDDVNESLGTLEFGEVAGGKNLIPYPYSNKSGNYNGVEITINDDYSISLNGTNTGERSDFGFAGISKISDMPYMVSLKEGKSYTLSLEFFSGSLPDTSEVIINGWNDDSVVKLLANCNSKNNVYTFTVLEGSGIKYGCIYLQNRTGLVFDNVRLRPMLTEGNEVVPYERYVPSVKMLADEVYAQKNDLGGLTFSASGTTLSITDGTNTWTLEANS